MKTKSDQNQPDRKTAPVVLAILDGWGIAPPGRGNAIAAARTPFLDLCRHKYPH